MLPLTVAGTVTIFQYGAGTAGVFRTLGKYMGASGGMFAYEPTLSFVDSAKKMTVFSWALAALYGMIQNSELFRCGELSIANPSSTLEQTSSRSEDDPTCCSTVVCSESCTYYENAREGNCALTRAHDELHHERYPKKLIQFTSAFHIHHQSSYASTSTCHLIKADKL